MGQLLSKVIFEIKIVPNRLYLKADKSWKVSFNFISSSKEQTKLVSFFCTHMYVIQVCKKFFFHVYEDDTIFKLSSEI